MTIGNNALRSIVLTVQLACATLAGLILDPPTVYAQDDEEEPSEPYQPMVETPPEEGPIEREQRQCTSVLSYAECSRMLYGGGSGARKGNAPPPKPDVWGALAISPSTLASGTSWNYKTESAASAAALAQCRTRGGSDCKIATTVADVCVALAVSNADKISAVGGPTGAGNFADDAALLKCRRAGGKTCAIQASFCADGERHELQGQTVLSNGNPIFVPTRPATGLGTSPAVPGDDTAKFFGTWTASFAANGQTVTVLSVHDVQGYRNFYVTPTGTVPAGNGTFSAANGRYSTNAAKPNDSGTYKFQNSELVVCTNAAGQTLTWARQAKPMDANSAAKAETGYQPPTARPGATIKK